MNYKDTINLPKTDFRMKARLQELEPEMQRRWDEMGFYLMVRQARKGADRYILHDGPPYPTGALHIGTGLNKILKDFLVRFRTMQGYDAPFRPGWDCHGLPIEVKVLEDLGEGRETTPTREIRRMCRRYAMKYVDIQKRQFKSLGVSGDWDNPYLTLAPGYEAGVLEVFAEMVGKGFVYRDLKPVHWCHHCATVLAEAELEYRDIPGPSIFVNFPLVPWQDQADRAKDLRETLGVGDQDETHVLIWTTTPWTLPANLAVAVHPRADYAALRYRHPQTDRPVVSIMAEALAESVLGLCGAQEHETLGRATGAELVGLTYRHPFIERVCPVVPAPYVTLQDGTGCVHTAPGHGLEDYQTALVEGLEVLSPVDEKGRFTRQAGMFAGQSIEEGDRTVVEHLAGQGYLLRSDQRVHSYPHCWRCHDPVIFRATSQWFVRLDHEGFRQEMLDAVDQTRWVPEWGRERMRSMVAERPDWCISRQKTWGVPIPAFYCTECSEALLTRESVLRVAGIFAESGADSWFQDEEAHPFLPEGTRCPNCDSTTWRKEHDIFDVWFESGSSHHSVCRRHLDLGFPADLYLEGTDQYRGWFQLSLLPSLAAWGQAPYGTVLTHGFVVDEEGRKMAKSLGNFISVEESVEMFRAEILRVWVLSVDFRDQIGVNPDYITRNMADAYRRVRNTFRFLLGNVWDFDPARDAVPLQELAEIDRWALDQTARLVAGVTRAFEQFELHRAYSLIHNFCTLQMSSLYLDVLKDRVYCSAAGWKQRRGAQTVLHHVLLTLCKLCAPVLVHTAEEVWSHVARRDEEQDSVHLCRWPQPPDEWLDDELDRRWQRILAIRDDVARTIESLRERKQVANSMEATVTLWSKDEVVSGIFREHPETLQELLMVSELALPADRPPESELEAMTCGEKEPGLMIAAAASKHPKCPRCWNLRPSVGKDAEYPDICSRCAEALRSDG